MSGPAELSIEEIRSFIVSRGGKVTNHDLVKHFKRFLTDPQRKDEARETFKKYVNLLGSIKNENGEKYIVLKRKKTPVTTPEPSANRGDESLTFSPSTSFHDQSEAREPPPYIPPPTVLQSVQIVAPQPPEMMFKQEILHRQHDNMLASAEPAYRQPEIVYRHPEAVYRQESIPKQTEPEFKQFKHSHIHSQHYDTSEIPNSVTLRRESIENVPPVALPTNDLLHRVTSSDNVFKPSASEVIKKQRINIVNTTTTQDVETPNVISESTTIHASSGAVKKQKKRLENSTPQEDNEDSNVASGISIRSESCRSLNSDCEPVSVKERLERFNKFAVDGDHSRRPSVKKGTEDEYQVSGMSLDAASREWVMKACAANYKAMVKLLNENPNLVSVRDPISNALHWAAKHGNEDAVKLCAGRCPELANQRSTSGGYTPLHVAMQFLNEGVYNLLIHVYGADREIRDNSGRKARQYQQTEDTSVSAEIYSRIMKKKQSDQKFLRIGSLNLRVKKTTHAFSNFLGVGTGHKNKNVQNLKLGKLTSWGSADDIQDDNNKMPPPQCTKVKRKIGKKSQEGFASKSRSTPSTPNQPRSLIGSDGNDNISPSPSSSTLHDSDSDTACGFDSHWQDKGK